MTLIPESMEKHFVRWAKMEYDTITELGIDVQILLYEQGSLDFEELKEVINHRDAAWQESWDEYRKYNRI